MATKILEICDALVTHLNDTVLATAAAVRSYVSSLELSDLEDLRVVVKPSPQTFAQSTAGMSARQTDYAINVALLQRAGDDLEVDAAVETLCDVEEGCRNIVLEGWRCIAAEIPILYDEVYLQEAKTFRGVVRLVFRGVE